ncbi:MAG TPA: pyridoxamine 5'-phosphate oxidase [Candidatus Saccharimonadales bacterium]|nr:pyridoxamine 5'-phosphate oxidase [Candidatus Saccharimonadales bacterium]
MALADIRREYSRGSLQRADLEVNPVAQFQKWFAQAAGEMSGGYWRRIGIALFKLWHAFLGHAPADPTAMVLATVNQDGQPSARTVLLKGVDARGFVFYTNHDSRKGRELAGNPNAALTFYWPDLERQVCIGGAVCKLSHEESEAYFKKRPRGSRLAAWASNQYDIVANRTALEKKWNEMAAKFPGDVPLPPNWGGFVLKPDWIEFWQGRPSRLHDRFRYTRQPDRSWKLERIAP